MTYENYIKGRLVEYAVNEAHKYGGVECMCAVAEVIANRVKNGWGDWSAVIDKAPQYLGTIVEPPTLDHRDPTFRQMLGLVDDIYHGTAESLINITDDRGTFAALYYADLSNINRDWFLTNVARKVTEHPQIAKVGELTFFA